MPLAGFQPAIPAYEQPQTHALDCAATKIGHVGVYSVYVDELMCILHLCRGGTLSNHCQFVVLNTLLSVYCADY
jgi:hypothetical protein